MNKTWRMLTLLIVLSPFLGPSSTAAQTLTDKVDKIFAQWNTTSSPGCALAVLKNGRIIYEHGYGMANLELGIAITPQSVFDIGSVECNSRLGKATLP